MEARERTGIGEGKTMGKGRWEGWREGLGEIEEWMLGVRGWRKVREEGGAEKEEEGLI